MRLETVEIGNVAWLNASTTNQKEAVELLVHDWLIWQLKIIQRNISGRSMATWLAEIILY